MYVHYVTLAFVNIFYNNCLFITQSNLLYVLYCMYIVVFWWGRVYHGVCTPIPT
jgi:hypothetical protein